jgi:hypothetical protein
MDVILEIRANAECEERKRRGFFLLFCGFFVVL